jgi:hypothetical protein
MGLAQPPGQEGDQVWIIFGCSTPMLLRPSQDGFLVVGDVYLDGFMDGKAVEGTKEPLNHGDRYGNFLIQNISLR